MLPVAASPTGAHLGGLGPGSPWLIHTGWGLAYNRRTRRGVILTNWRPVDPWVDWRWEPRLNEGSLSRGSLMGTERTGPMLIGMKRPRLGGEGGLPSRGLS